MNNNENKTQQIFHRAPEKSHNQLLQMSDKLSPESKVFTGMQVHFSYKTICSNKRQQSLLFISFVALTTR